MRSLPRPRKSSPRRSAPGARRTSSSCARCWSRRRERSETSARSLRPRRLESEAFGRRAKDAESLLQQAETQMKDLETMLASPTPLKVTPSEGVSADRTRAGTLLASATGQAPERDAHSGRRRPDRRDADRAGSDNADRPGASPVRIGSRRGDRGGHRGPSGQHGRPRDTGRQRGSHDRAAIARKARGRRQRRRSSSSCRPP